MKRFFFTGLICLALFVAIYHGFRYLFVGPWGWQWEDIGLGAMTFILGSGATLYYIRYFTWRDKTQKERLEILVNTRRVPEDFPELTDNLAFLKKKKGGEQS